MDIRLYMPGFFDPERMFFCPLSAVATNDEQIVTDEGTMQTEATVDNKHKINKNAVINGSQNDHGDKDDRYNQDIINKIIDDFVKEKDELVQQCKALKKQNEQLWNQSAEVFRKNKSSTLENICDEFPTLELVKKLTHLYNDEWFDICSKDPHNHQLIKSLSFLMQEVNNQCNLYAEKQLRCFLNIQENKPVPSRHKKPELYRLRRLENMDAEKISNFAQYYVQQMLKEEYPHKDHVYAIGQPNEFSDFFEGFIHVCWQLAITDEDVLLDFDAVNQLYDGVIRQRFDKCNIDFPTNGQENVVIMVVWPCVRKTDDKASIIEKGFVIVNEKYNKTEERANSL